jgi:SAM-dependent methyltransferase
VLEIGCGTGQATLPLARRGLSVLCIELGASLAAVARRNLAAFPDVEVVNANFESWPAADGAFDLVTAATSVHWIDPSIRYYKIARMLKPGGAVAPFRESHAQTDKSPGFFEEVQHIYERVAPEIVDPEFRGLPRPEDVPTPEVGRIEATGLYGPVTVRRYPFEVEYDSEGYINLLSTYSGHRALAPAVRARLLRAIAELIDTTYGGRISKGYLATLCVARRL